MARLVAAMLLLIWCLIVASGILFFVIAGGTTDTDIDRSSVPTLLVIALVGFVIVGALVATTRRHHRIRSRYRRTARPEPLPEHVEQ